MQWKYLLFCFFLVTVIRQLKLNTGFKKLQIYFIFFSYETQDQHIHIKKTRPRLAKRRPPGDNSLSPGLGSYPVTHRIIDITTANTDKKLKRHNKYILKFLLFFRAGYFRNVLDIRSWYISPYMFCSQSVAV